MVFGKNLWILLLLGVFSFILSSIFSLGAAPDPPEYWDNSTNSTLAGEPVEFRLRWTCGYELVGYIFSLDNCTGSFENITSGSLSGYEDWSNVTHVINSTIGCTIRWKVYANNTNLDWSTSDEYSFKTTDEDTTPPNIAWEDPTPPDGNVTSDNYVYLNTTITDVSNTSAFFDWNYSLVGYWSFEYYNDTGIFDNSSYNNFGNFSGVSLDNITTGKYGKGLEFDGDNDYIQIAGDSSLKPNSTLTITAWIKAANTDSGGAEVASMGDDYMLRVSTNGNLFFGFWMGTTWRTSSTTGVDVLDNQWHQVVVTKSATNQKFYVDDWEASLATGGSHTDNITYVHDPNFYIGKQGDGNPNFDFDGSIDEVRIYNRALSADEINASYNNGAYRLKNNFTSL
ncbi:MAG: LamG domain-containing protein, partial [Candidatus Aenigmarchaeota archaeon]|nr:LamG domain-containing protein [Candidatus Aenigmarchaeota archaeon]